MSKDDFSKIEARLLAAHIDQKIIHGWHYQMAKAVAEDQDDRTSPALRRDFYRDFAAEAYGVRPDKVTEEMKSHVKALFWASLYGADDWSKHGVKMVTLQTDYHDGHISQDMDHQDRGDKDRLSGDVHGCGTEEVPPVRET